MIIMLIIMEDWFMLYNVDANLSNEINLAKVPNVYFEYDGKI